MHIDPVMASDKMAPTQLNVLATRTGAWDNQDQSFKALGHHELIDQ